MATTSTAGTATATLSALTDLRSVSDPIQTDSDIQFYRPSTIARLLEVNVRTVYRWISEGSLRAVPFGARALRVPRLELKRFVEHGR